MELKDTVNLMLSDDYKDRFRAEYYQAKIRRDKLHALLETYPILDFEPDTDYHRLWLQLTTMDSYLEQLLKRAYLEEIAL